MSFVVGLVVLGLKFLAYRLTGSVALYSDALESVVNVAAAAVMFVVVRISARPPDADHPYGHTKAEYFSAVVEGVLIVVAAVSIVLAAWSRLRAPVPVVRLDVGVAVSLAASLANAGLAAYLFILARRLRSPALRADALHLATDLVTSVGVLVGIGAAAATGLWVLDPVLAILVAANILRVGAGLVRDSVGGLMDEAVPADQAERIRQALQASLDGALEAHAVRSRRAGTSTFVEMHLVVPSGMTVASAHEICDRIEAAVEAAVPGSQVTVHVEPEGHLHDQHVPAGRIRPSQRP